MSDIVKFLQPDGTEVSNDPRWLAEQKMSLAEVVIEGTPNTGTVGITDAEQAAQIGGGMAPLQSGQEGVGPNATLTQEQLEGGPLTGRALQVEDARGATSPKQVENPDSNAAVLQAREDQAAAEAEAKAALDKLAQQGEEPGDPEKPFSEWNAKQLQAEIKVRNSGREEADRIDTSDAKRKGDLVKLLNADDEAQASDSDDS